MNNPATSIELLLEKAENFGKTSLELYRLKLLDKSTEAISQLITHLLVFMVVALFVFFISIGCSLYIGAYWGNNYYGFFAVGGFYLILALVIYAFRISLIKLPINNALIAQLENKKDDETK